MSDRVDLQFVSLWLCDLCLDGEGGECHMPGCALWMNRAPDLPIRDKVQIPAVSELEHVLKGGPSDA